MNESRRFARPRKIRWEELEADHPMPLLERRRAHGERMTVARVLLEKGFVIDPHIHDEEQITIVLSGKIRFLVGEAPDRREVVVVADEVMLFPPNVPHGAEALEETVVLDLFSPSATRTGIDNAGGLTGD